MSQHQDWLELNFCTTLRVLRSQPLRHVIHIFILDSACARSTGFRRRLAS